MKSLIRSTGKPFLIWLISFAVLAGLSLPIQAQQNNQPISQPDLAIVSGIESMSDATKDALTTRGFLVKKKIRQTWHYELETIVYRSFPPNAELLTTHCYGLAAEILSDSMIGLDWKHCLKPQ